MFNVPKSLILSSPESYIPQQIALGPYHHSRPKLYEMERCKLASAKRSQKNLQGLKFSNLVNRLNKFDSHFRACYQKFLNLNGETLTWMMVVDSCFLLEFLQVFVVRDPGKYSGFSSRMIGRKSGFDAVIRDIVKLENQIPLFSLTKTLEFQSMIYEMLTGLGREIMPVRVIQDLPDFNQVIKCAHLLDFLYNSIVPKLDRSLDVTSEAGKDDRNGGEKIINNFHKIMPVSLTSLDVTSDLNVQCSQILNPQQPGIIYPTTNRIRPRITILGPSYTKWKDANLLQQKDHKKISRA